MVLCEDVGLVGPVERAVEIVSTTAVFSWSSFVYAAGAIAVVIVLVIYLRSKFGKPAAL
jgi:hypothetical protein